MTKEEALKSLQYFQKWRLGANTPQPEPKVITAALKVAINELKKQLKTKKP